MLVEKIDTSETDLCSGLIPSKLMTMIRKRF